MMPLWASGVVIENQAFKLSVKHDETGFVSLWETCPILPVREVL